MSNLKLPDDMEAVFRLEYRNAFAERYAINVHGHGRKGWFVANRGAQTSGLQPMTKGQWRTFLNLIVQAGFWELPSDIPRPDNFEMDDGESICLMGRDMEKSHHINRFWTIEPAILRICLWMRTLSGLFPEHHLPRPVVEQEIADSIPHIDETNDAQQE